MSLFQHFDCLVVRLTFNQESVAVHRVGFGQSVVELPCLDVVAASSPNVLLSNVRVVNHPRPLVPESGSIELTQMVDDKPDSGTQFCSGSQHTFGVRYSSQEPGLAVHFDARIKIQFVTGVFLPDIRLLGVDL